MEAILLSQARAAAVAEMRSTAQIVRPGPISQDEDSGEWSSLGADPTGSIPCSLSPTTIQGGNVVENSLEENRSYFFLSLPFGTSIKPTDTLTVDGTAMYIDEVMKPTDPQALVIIIRVYR